MKRQHKILFRNAPKSIRKALMQPDGERFVMDYLVPKPSGYTGI